MEPFTLRRGTSPLVVSMPHSGTAVPAALAARFSDAARRLPDTDWHIPRLYAFLDDMDVTVITATQSRYVIDLNRDPEGRPLYPGASNTELCPTTTFDDQPIYAQRDGLDDDEVAERRAGIWQPYHARLSEALAEAKARHGLALLWDAHSIRSHVPRFFEGRLPDLNLGTGEGTSAAQGLANLLQAVARDAQESLGFSHALNGRFKGGYITRHHGRPEEGCHAVQLELSQITYMEEAHPFAYRAELAEKIQPVLAGLIQTMLAWAELEKPA